MAVGEVLSFPRSLGPKYLKGGSPLKMVGSGPCLGLATRPASLTSITDTLGSGTYRWKFTAGKQRRDPALAPFRIVKVRTLHRRENCTSDLPSHTL